VRFKIAGAKANNITG